MPASENVDRVKQEVERWIEVARSAGERTLEAMGMTPVLRSTSPAVDVLETTDEVEIWIDIPGVGSDAVQLAATETELTVTLNRPEPSEASGKYHLRERSAASCERRIPLPTSVNPDRTSAQLRDGVLHVTLMKHKTSEPRTVPVNVT